MSSDPRRHVTTENRASATPAHAPTRVELVEMSPRDGLQNEAAVLSTEHKLELVERAVRAGHRRIEVTSFVNPARVPQMADADELMAALPRRDGIRYAGLVLNRRGLNRALAAGVDEVDVVVVASDTFSMRNQGTTTEQGCLLAAEIVSEARAAGVFTTVTVAAAFGCPFEGEVPLARLREVVTQVVDSRARRAGARRHHRGGRAGRPGRPVRHGARGGRPRAALQGAPARHPAHRRGQCGRRGRGWGDHSRREHRWGRGCPFAPNATGNVATEDLLYLFERTGIATGVDLAVTTETVAWLEERLGKRLPGALLRAGDFPTPGASL